MTTLDPDHSGIDLWPLLSIPHMSPALVPPMPALSVCTVGARELSDRTDRGEEHFDVIEEHTSWFWFRNREGYEIARRTARSIRRGRLMQGDIPTGTGLFCPNVGDVPCAPIVIRASAHHVVAPERPASRFERRARAGLLGRDAISKAVIAQFTWKDMPRICLPGYFIRRAVEALAVPLYRAGPSICQQLERRLEQPDGIRGPECFRDLQRSTALWLTQSPNSVQPAIPEETRAEASSPSMHDPLKASAPGSLQCEVKE